MKYDVELKKKKNFLKREELVKKISAIKRSRYQHGLKKVQNDIASINLSSNK